MWFFGQIDSDELQLVSLDYLSSSAAEYLVQIGAHDLTTSWHPADLDRDMGRLARRNCISTDPARRFQFILGAQQFLQQRRDAAL